MTVGLTRVDAPGGSILWIAGNGTGSEMSSASRSRLDGPIGVGYPSRTTPTDVTRRDSAVPILSCPGARVRASTDRDRPAPTAELRREQIERELSERAQAGGDVGQLLERGRPASYAASRRAEIARLIAAAGRA